MKQLCFPADQEQINKLLSERKFDYQDQRLEVVNDIMERVRTQGDQALFHYTQRFDGAVIDRLQVSPAEIDKAYQLVEEDFKDSLQKSITNVKNFHREQLNKNWFTYENGCMTGQLITPLARVGVYVPGGRAAYPSSVVMTVAPARVAGVDEVVMVTPPDQEGNVNPYTLVAAAELGVEEIYKVGGAQAVAGLAFGTESIRTVDKIIGPGNIYVTLAKKLVYGLVDIDMLAGPSEVLILADETARPEYLAADLLSQAEHDPLAVPILLTDSIDLARQVESSLEKQLRELDREEIARQSITEQGLIVLVDNIQQGIELVNSFAPEHFELVVREPFAVLSGIRNAGAIFIGEYSAEPAGDYLAGPNHVLPTGGTARFASPLNTDDYLKKSSIIYYQQRELEKEADDIIRLARLEGLDAHARAIAIRFAEKGDNPGGKIK